MDPLMNPLTSLVWTSKRPLKDPSKTPQRPLKGPHEPLTGTKPSELGRPRNCPYELRVHIYKIKGLQASDSNGLADPFVVVRCADQKFKTRVIHNTVNTLWTDPL
jgi:hypothetical protein